MVVDELSAALKQALLARDSETATILRGLKSVILNAEVAAGKRDDGLPNDEVLALLQKESKKRAEAAKIFADAGDQDRAATELHEKELIDTFLPAQLSEDEISGLVDEAIAAAGASSIKEMGAVMGQVKAKAGPSVDGAVLARIVKGRLSA